MNHDIFETLDQAGFGSNVHEVAADGECRVLRLDDESGDGFMTMYRVFDGIYLMYNDFHLHSCTSEYQNADTVLCIDHCREGRIEHENSLGERYYMEAGDLRIDRRVHHEGKVVLPLSHYHGITIGFLQRTAQDSLRREIPFLSVDLDMLGEKFCPDNKEFLLRTNESMNIVFSQLYHAPKKCRIDYFRVKIAELLLLLSDIDTSAYSEQRQYFPASQTAKVKEIHALITSRLEKTFTVEELSDISGVPPTSLRKVFKAVYGAPVYQYLKAYKMKAAAEMLISERSLNIADIAQRLGYDNASKFSAAFRDIMGVTPQNYRSRQEEM
ncbi:MAG: AraC family transcriptional regulator [Ruminococcus sp.]|uniref:helix-turn-helix domain-containing protein n=1 Tax=Ruminococcus sp. TaxID=41978 RepID=UPI0025CF5570|nr:AraC family transcriptional regulator [Ruminococcus sp.]MCR5541228.1 AraC family transcriptional regulator [Ruminococcus sp.]